MHHVANGAEYSSGMMLFSGAVLALIGLRNKIRLFTSIITSIIVPVHLVLKSLYKSACNNI
jgi:ethanolamine transporter EutH